MKYIIVAIFNFIYGILLLLSLSQNTIGFYLVLIVGLLLTIFGLLGIILWLKKSLTQRPDIQIKNEQNLKSWFSLIKSIDIVLILAFITRTFLIQPFVVDGNSMEPNFHNNQYLLVDKLSLRFRQPQRGEAIIFKAPPNPQDDYIKRIIGLPNETIEINNSLVYINGKLLKEPYVEEGSRTLVNNDPEKNFKIKLNSQQFFVMGDNRYHSSDSRDWGALPKKNLIGLPRISVYPFAYFGWVKNKKYEYFYSFLPKFNHSSLRFVKALI